MHGVISITGVVDPCQSGLAATGVILHSDSDNSKQMLALKRIMIILLMAVPLMEMHSQSADHPSGLTVEQFLLNTNVKKKLVLVSFKADWCVVCRKQDPIVEEVSAEKGDTVKVIVINLEDNPLIGEYLEIDGLPLHMLYFEGTRVWEKLGMLPKPELLEILKLYQRILIKK
jgi:thioredoxin 1